MTFTPTEQRILAVLADGRAHSRDELMNCLADDLGELGTLHQHISNVRKKLRERGEEIVCELARRFIYYRHVRLLLPPS